MTYLDRDLLAHMIYDPQTSWLRTVDGSPNAESYAIADRIIGQLEQVVELANLRGFAEAVEICRSRHGDPKVFQEAHPNTMIGGRGRPYELKPACVEAVVVGVPWTAAYDPDRPTCPACGLRADIPGEGRFCGNCGDHEGTCPEDHCMTCGGST